MKKQFREREAEIANDLRGQQRMQKYNARLTRVAHNRRNRPCTYMLIHACLNLGQRGRQEADSRAGLTP